MAGASHRWHKEKQYVVFWEHGWGQATGNAASRNKAQSGNESTSHGKMGCAGKLGATVDQQGTHQPFGCHIHPMVCPGLAQQEATRLFASLQLPPAQVTTAPGQLLCPLCVRTPSVPSWPLWGCCQGSATHRAAPLLQQGLGEQGPAWGSAVSPWLGHAPGHRGKSLSYWGVWSLCDFKSLLSLCHHLGPSFASRSPASLRKERRTLGFSWHGATRSPAARQREERRLSQE